MLYAKLGLDGFEAFEPKLKQYVDSLAGYQKNDYDELPEHARQAVARSWRRSFNEWNYPLCSEPVTKA